MSAMSDTGRSLLILGIVALWLAGTPSPALSEEFARTLARAESGNADAQYRLGLIYLEGRGIERDEAWAITWLRRAADAGHVAARERLTRVLQESGVTSRAAAKPQRPAPDAATATGDPELPAAEQRAIALARRHGIRIYFGAIKGALQPNAGTAVPAPEARSSGAVHGTAPAPEPAVSANSAGAPPKADDYLIPAPVYGEPASGPNPP